MSKITRLNDAYGFIRDKGKVHTQKDLAIKMQASPANVSKALKGDPKVLTDSFIERFNNSFDNMFNMEWLLTGKGEMLSPDYDVANDNNNEHHTVLLLPVSAQGGSLSEFSISIRDTECERIISPLRDVDFAIAVKGDSMEPEFPSGSIVFIKKIDASVFIDWGRPYVLDTVNGSIIKRLYPSKKEGVVICKSVNKAYPPYELYLSDVLGIFRVMACTTFK